MALDIARVLAKNADELRDTDIAPAAMAAICSSPVRDIYLVGRRSPADAKFTNIELREMATLADASIGIDPGCLPDPEAADGSWSRLQRKNLHTFREFARAERADNARRRIHFIFNTVPIEISGIRQVTGLRLTRASDREALLLRCGAVVTATGFRPAAVAGLPVTRQGLLCHDNGKVDDRLYAVGWLARGASGVIGSNKPDAYATAKRVLSEVTPDQRRAGRRWLEARIGRTQIATLSG
ncbi:hypothetical protein [Bradyrhizobium cenepequi]